MTICYFIKFQTDSLWHVASSLGYIVNFHVIKINVNIMS